MSKLNTVVFAMTLMTGCLDDELEARCPTPKDCYVEDGVVHTDFKNPPRRVQYGTTKCSDTGEVECLGEVLPEPETCDGIDNDGDGRVDGLTRSFGDSEYRCDYQNRCASKDRCVAGQWACYPDPSFVKEEACNGLDDDCDGDIDEGLDQPRFDYPYEDHPGTLGRGACRAAVEYCSDGELVIQPAVIPEDETCFDDVDNDCDGETDEDLHVTEQALVLVVDLSGSMLEELVAISTAICQAAQDPVADALTHVRVVRVADSGVAEYPWVAAPSTWGSLTDACLELAVLPWGLGEEYMIEGAYAAAQSWPTGVPNRRQILLTDEQIQIADTPLTEFATACTDFGFRADVVTTGSLAATWGVVAQSCGGGAVTSLPTISTPQSLVDTITSVIAEGC